MTHGGTNQFRSQAKLYELLEHAICEETPPGLAQLWREVGTLAELLVRDWRDERDLPSLMRRLAGCLATNTPYR